MDHVAIDLGSRESQICIRDAHGTIVKESRACTEKLGELVKKLPERSRVIVETSAEAFAVADIARECRHQVRVVPATLVKSLGVGARGIKTDRRDAQTLSEVSTRIDLPSVHVPSRASREVQALCGMREALVETRTKLINSVRGYLRTLLIRPRGAAIKTFAQRVRETFDKRDIELPRFVERQLESIEHLCEQIAEADREVATAAGEDPVCARLMTTPGIGPVTALRFVAAIDEVERFSGAHQVESYVGLTPGERSSGVRTWRTGITKAGRPKLRWALVQAGWAGRRSRHRHDPLFRWVDELEKRRGKMVAAVALARKLVGILYAIWRDGTVYDPSRAAQG
jgi:transposase